MIGKVSAAASYNTQFISREELMHWKTIIHT